MVLLFLMLFIGGIVGYVIYVNQQMDEAGWNTKKKSSSGKIRKKDRAVGGSIFD